jgi:hypothetical protein
VFAPTLIAWEEIVTEAELTVRETIISEFTASCRAYVAQRRDFRLASAGLDASMTLDLSPALCEPLSRLSAEMHGAHSSLPPASFQRVLLPIATAIDEFLYAQVVRRATFSLGGIRQLSRDVGALCALFQPLSAKPHTLRRLHESCQLLCLDAYARSDLLRCLLMDTPPQPQRAEHEASLRRRLEDWDVFRLSLGEVAELLAGAHEDDSVGGNDHVPDAAPDASTSTDGPGVEPERASS